MTGKTLGHYRVGEQLGRGGMGEVYLADDLNLSRKVALKFLPDAFAADPERMARFEREAKLLASLNHPNIAAIYGLEQAEGKRFLVLELVEGETLAQRLSKGALSVEEALGVCRQIAEALEAAHDKGVIHRDLKPANVMITSGDKVKILDFGLAKALADETQSVDSSQSPTLTEAMTRPGVILGTAAYMSPEQAKGKAVDKRADIWAFGCILYECLSGKRAFEGETVTETLAAILKSEPDWQSLPATTPPNIRFVLRRCLEKETSRRFRDAADVRIQIEEVRSIGEARAPSKQQVLWISWSVATLAVLIAIVLVFLYFREKPSASAEATHLQIVPTVKLTSGSLFSLSPDGRKLVFMAVGPDGATSLWVRSMDSLEVRPLPGTGTVTPVFWSPDSRYIAFWTGTQLKKINISGGPAQTLCNYENLIIGGSWNRDGVIIFGSNTAGVGLMRVSASGGTVSPVTVPDPSRQEKSHKFPSFLPDGRHFLYWRNSSILENSGLYVGSLDAKPKEQTLKRLMAVNYGTAYAPSPDSSVGQLLFLRDDMLMSQPFDDKRLELKGEPIAVADNVGSILDGGYFSVSKNGILVYRGGGSQFTQAALFDRKGEALRTAGESGIYYGLALSPDGSRAAASSVDWTNTVQLSEIADIWLLSLSRGTNTRFTFGQGRNVAPAWSPDGSRITFASDRDGGVWNLYQKLASGVKNEELLLKSSEPKIPTSWSMDGRFLLYTAEDPKTKGDLWVLPLEGDRKPIPFLRTAFNEFDGRFSPDMRWVAYVSDESGSNEVYVRGFSKTAAGISMEAGGKWLVSKGGGIGPRWRGDGRELFYRSADGSVMVIEITADSVFQAATPKPLFKLPYPSMMSGLVKMNSLDGDVGSDGNRFLVLSQVAESFPFPFTVVLNWTALLKK